MRRALVILSGGQDSTTCLYWAKEQFDEVHAITFNYGQTHQRELESARWIAEAADIMTHAEVNLNHILVGTSPLINNEAPEQYESWQKLPGGLEATFVPARNILFLTVAANRAYALGATHIITGVSQEDFGGYPDCRATFIEAMQQALRVGLTLSSEEPMAKLKIHTPLINMTKQETVDLAVSLRGCMEALAYSHTAYDNAYPPTGKDHATLLRAKGFELAGYPDPLVLRAATEGLISLPETENYTDEALAKEWT